MIPLYILATSAAIVALAGVCALAEKLISKLGKEADN
jgi:hypothetical protein